MTAYTDEVDRDIVNYPRTIEPGDLVTRKGHSTSFGHAVWVDVEDNGVGVLWPEDWETWAYDIQDIVYVERPEAYVSLMYNGHDTRGEVLQYDLVLVGTPEFVIVNLENFQKAEGFTVRSSRLGDPKED